MGEKFNYYFLFLVNNLTVKLEIILIYYFYFVTSNNNVLTNFFSHLNTLNLQIKFDEAGQK